MENMPDCVQTYSTTQDAPCDNILPRLNVLSEELQAYGCPPLPDLESISVVEHEELLNAVINGAFHLIGNYRTLLKKRDDLDDTRRRILDDKNALTTTVKTLRYDLRQTEDNLLKVQQDRNEMRLNLAKAQSDVKLHKDEIRRLNCRIKSMVDQADHDRRKKELEVTKLRNQLHHTIGLPVADRRAAKKAIRQALPTNQPPPSAQQALAVLEANNKVLLQDNRMLAGALGKITSDLAVLVGEFSGIVDEETEPQEADSGDQAEPDASGAAEDVAKHLAIAGKHFLALSSLAEKLRDRLQ